MASAVVTGAPRCYAPWPAFSPFVCGSCNIDDHHNGAADVNGGEVENVETGGALCEQNWSHRQQQPGKCTWTFSFTSPPIGPIFLSHTNLSHVQVFRIPILPSTKAQVSHMHAILLQWHHQATGAGVNPIFLWDYLWNLAISPNRLFVYIIWTMTLHRKWYILKCTAISSSLICSFGDI